MRLSVALGVASAALVLIAATGCGGSTPSAAPVVHKCSFYPKSAPRPQTCLSKLANAPCSAYSKHSKPLDCLSTAQVAQQKKAAKRAAAHARWLAKRRAAEARRLAAARARANAWHRGYFEQSGSVYWKWVNGASCADYAMNGCWHVAVITKYGCPSYVAVNANEYQGRSIIGQLLANQGYGIPAKTERIFELDADTGDARSQQAGDVTIDCE